MAKFGIGASVLRKEDDRFLRGRGQYVGDFRLAGTREIAFAVRPLGAEVHDLPLTPERILTAIEDAAARLARTATA
jgi:aerobic carbon-monoxide dehydrogenase large subunit